jgi:hypothetical protein
MRSNDKAYPWKDLIVMTSSGTVDLDASKAALKSLADDPDFLPGYEVLLDWRDVECTMSVGDVFEIAKYLTDLDTKLPTRKKIAILVSGRLAFDHAQFLELCAGNRGVTLHAFDDYDKASAWLNTTLPADPQEQVAVTGSNIGASIAVTDEIRY